jgi:hypothetical protein
MERTHTTFLPDDELRPQLEVGDTIVFTGTTVRWQEIERQVERLGFGDSYIVIATCVPGSNSKISLKPKSIRE